MKQSKRGRQIAFLFLFLLGIFWIIPIVWLIFNSFKYDSDFITSFCQPQRPLGLSDPHDSQTVDGQQLYGAVCRRRKRQHDGEHHEDVPEFLRRFRCGHGLHGVHHLSGGIRPTSVLISRAAIRFSGR